ncbi:MAG: sporulation protein YabP [Clostridia bacterium]|nr:sporulation protein YabP [Clostridia bacterium]
METQDNGAARAHWVELKDRKKLNITGVEDVDCFNEQIVVLQTPLGTLTVTGAGLNVSQLDLEAGKVALEGEVDALEYTGGRRKGGVLGRLFR